MVRDGLVETRAASEPLVARVDTAKQQAGEASLSK
jgi:hypothetical protein